MSYYMTWFLLNCLIFSHIPLLCFWPWIPLVCASENSLDRIWTGANCWKSRWNHKVIHFDVIQFPMEANTFKHVCMTHKIKRIESTKWNGIEWNDVKWVWERDENDRKWRNKIPIAPWSVTDSNFGWQRKKNETDIKKEYMFRYSVHCVVSKNNNNK